MSWQEMLWFSSTRHKSKTYTAVKWMRMSKSWHSYKRAKIAGEHSALRLSQPSCLKEVGNMRTSQRDTVFRNLLSTAQNKILSNRKPLFSFTDFCKSLISIVKFVRNSGFCFPAIFCAWRTVGKNWNSYACSTFDRCIPKTNRNWFTCQFSRA